MKKQFEILLSALLLLGMTATAYSQSDRGKKQNTDNGQSEFVISAKETSQEIGMLLPAVQKVRSAQARSFVSTLKRAQELSDQVQRAGAGMSDQKYQVFQSKLRALEVELNKIAAKQDSAAGDPKPGTVGECHKSCHDAFGDGFGGGKGWNRFVCKIGCIKVSFPGGAGAGG